MMNQPSFSTYTLKALAEIISGGSGNDPSEPIGIYRSASQMERLLLDCNLNFNVGSQSRVPALLEFLRYTATQPEGYKDIIRVLCHVADPREYLRHPGKAQATLDYLNQALAADGYELAINGSIAELRRRGSSGAVVDLFAAKAAIFDFDTVNREIKRALASADTDPEDALTAACALIEAVCRSVLIELGLDLPARRDVEALIHAVQEPLGLSPARTDFNPEIAADVRQILGGLTTIAKGTGALRTHAGDAHGRERGFVRIDARIARLAIHTASTLALFLIETWERKSGKALPKRINVNGRVDTADSEGGSQ